MYDFSPEVLKKIRTHLSSQINGHDNRKLIINSGKLVSLFITALLSTLMGHSVSYSLFLLGQRACYTFLLVSLLSSPNCHLLFAICLHLPAVLIALLSNRIYTDHSPLFIFLPNGIPNISSSYSLPHASAREAGDLRIIGYPVTVSCLLLSLDLISYHSRLELRRCCRNFRDVIDTSATYYDSVTVEFFENRAKILAEGMTFYYETHQDGYMFKMNDKRGRRYRVVKGKGNFIDRALRFVESIFKHPKKSVERLEFGFVHKKTSIRRYQQIKDEFIDKMNQLMARTPYLLRVRIFALHMKLTEQDVLTFIRYCRPGTLKHIHLWHRITEPDTIPIDFLSEVAETEQWKRAKKFSQIDFPVSLPYEKWSHLQFHMCEVPTLTMHTLTSMIKVSESNKESYYCRPATKTVSG